MLPHLYGNRFERSRFPISPWYDEGAGKVFCLCQAASKQAAAAVHREAHGAMADEIVVVREGAKRRVDVA